MHNFIIILNAITVGRWDKRVYEIWLPDILSTHTI